MLGSQPRDVPLFDEPYGQRDFMASDPTEILIDVITPPAEELATGHVGPPT